MKSSPLTEEQKAKLLEIMVAPVMFAEAMLHADVWGTQAAILNSIATKPRTAVKACHSSGKTFIAACAALWFLARWPEAIVVTTAPTHQQVEKLLWGEIHSALSKSRYEFPKATLTELKFGPKRYAIGFTTSVTKQDEGVKFQGFHAEHILVILDEAPGVDPKIWEAIEGARAGGNVSILALGNPTIASGPFHEAFHGARAGWSLFTISAFDTPNLAGIYLEYEVDGQVTRLGTGDRDLLSLEEDELDQNIRPYLTTRRWVKEKFLEWGPGHPLWESRVCGNFPAQGEDALISLTWLENAKASPRVGEGLLWAGLDVAGPGEDETVLTIRRGPQILFHKGWPDSDPRGKVVAALKSFGEKKDYQAINVDSAGIGWGLYLHLKDLKFPAVPINVGESPRDSEKYANLKAELYWGLRMRLQVGDMSGLLDETAIGQLAGIRYKHDARGRVLIESKEDARKRGVKSPDRAESIMLAFAQRSMAYGLLEAMKKLEEEQMGKRKKGQANKPANVHDGLEKIPSVLPPAPDSQEAIEAQAAALAPEPAIQPTQEIVKIDLPDNVDRCPECSSVLWQKIPGGRRCGNCGTQQMKIGLGLQPHPGQVRK